MNIAEIRTASKIKEFTQLTIHYEEESKLAWYYMHPQPRPCFTTTLLKEIKSWQDQIISELHREIEYVVFASGVPGIFCLGGDLDLFVRMIRNKDEEGLSNYIRACINTMYRNHIGLGKGITTISLIQGDALGGGMESAISSQVVIAERHAKMGLPDILFNLFPGAGAYSMLARKVGAKQAERMILSGRLYSAEEMFEVGVVDVLVETGQGESAVYEYIKKEKRMRRGVHAFRQAKRFYNPLTLEELLAAGDVWVQAALSLDEKDLRMMERLVKRQTAKAK